MLMLLQAHRAMQHISTMAYHCWKATGSICTVWQLNLISSPPEGAEAWPLQLQPPQGLDSCSPAAAWRQPADKLHGFQHHQGCLPCSQAQMLTDRGSLLNITGLGSWVCSQTRLTWHRCAGVQDLKGKPAAAHNPSLAKPIDAERHACLRPQTGHQAGQSRETSHL